MPKKQPRNAFYFFMQDYKARCERNGERFPNGLRDVQDPAGAEWKVLTPAMKKPYEDKAKAEKEKGKGDIRGKVTSLHNSFAFIDKRNREEELAKQARDEYLERTLRSLSYDKSRFAAHKFYLVHANYLIVSEGQNYHAVEVAIAEFCLADGVTNTYHTLIDPGRLPLGYTHDANLKSEQTHRIPVDNPMGVKDKIAIFKHIKNILKPGRDFEGGAYPPLYTVEDNVAANTSMSCVANLIEVMCDNAGEDPAQFRIYPLDRLFFSLKAKAAQFDDAEGFPSLALAANEIERDVNAYVCNIACKFHQEHDRVEYCCLSYVQRWAFLCCDHCCQYVGVKLIPGKHCPSTTNVNYVPESHMKQVQAQKSAEAAPFTWVDKSKPSSTNWNPVEPKPLPRPTRQSLPVGLSNKMQNLQVSDENFPTINIGRGRGGGSRGAQNSGAGKPFNYAAAMKK